MGRWGKSLRAPASLCALCCILALSAGREAVAQDVLSGSGPTGGAGFGTLGAAAFGAGPFGLGGYGLNSAAALSSSPTNVTSLGLSAGVGETDNVLFTSSPKQSQTLGIGGVNFAVSRHESQLSASMAGNFEDMYFVQHAFSNQLMGSFSGDATAGLIPGRLNWVIDENYGQNLISPLVQAVPTNLQNVNVMSTGPDLLLHPGGQSNFLQLGARYARADYASTPFSGYDGIGLFALGHDLSPVSSVAVHVSDQKMFFYNTVVNQDFSLRKAYGSYQVNGVRTTLELDAGAGQVNDGPGRTTAWSTTPIAQIILTRKLSPTMTVSLQGGRQVTDIADSFATLQGSAAGQIVIASAYGSTSSYIETFASAGWTFALNRTTLGATASWQKDAYDLAPLLDATLADYQVQLTRQITPLFSVQLIGAYARTDYYAAHFSSGFPTVDAALNWQVGPKLQASLQYQYSAASTTGVTQLLGRSGYFNLISASPVNTLASYSANTVFLMLTYVPFSE